MSHVSSDTPRLNFAAPGHTTADMMIGRAGWAADAFQSATLKDVRKIARAVAQAAHDKADFHADWAVRETGYGVREHKKQKNEFSAFPLLEYYSDLDLVTPKILPEQKVVEIPRPAGVIFGLIPVTNPISTLNYKTILAILSRNAIVFSPHPGARECSLDAVRNLARAAEKAGAPAGLIQCVERPSVPLVEHMMASSKISVIMATGGGAMVRAAYSSGNPALGVGPGNGVAWVDNSAKLDEAARRIVESKSYDNSVLCTNESVLLAPRAIFPNLVRAMRTAGAHICNDEETAKLRDWLFPDGKFNLAAIGKSAVWIAEKVGIRVARTAKVLVPVLETPDADEVFLREKLCPVLAMGQVEDFSGGLSLARQIARRGAGHSAAFHGTDEARILKFSAEMPVYRVVVNAPLSQGGAGLATHLPPTFMIGTGYKGRSSVGENVGPQHLVHWTRIAYNKDALVPFGKFDPTQMEQSAPKTGLHAIAPPPPPSAVVQTDAPDRDMLRRLILEELQSLTGGKK